MKRLIFMQLIIGILLVLLYAVIYYGSLLDVKYNIEESVMGIDDGKEVVYTVYNIIFKLVIPFILLALLLIVNSFLMLRKLKNMK